MKNKILLVLALQATALSFASKNWDLEINAGYKATIENKVKNNENEDEKEEIVELTKDVFTSKEKFLNAFKPTMPVSLKLDLHPEGTGFNSTFEIKNDKLDGLFKNNNLNESLVKVGGNYTTPVIFKGTRLYGEANVVIYKEDEKKDYYKEESGDVELKLGSKFDIKGHELAIIGKYTSNRLYTSKTAGGEVSLSGKYGNIKVESYYDFETKTMLENGAINKTYIITSDDVEEKESAFRLGEKTKVTPFYVGLELGANLGKVTPNLKLNTKFLLTNGENLDKLNVTNKDYNLAITGSDLSRLEAIKTMTLNEADDKGKIHGLRSFTTNGELNLPMNFGSVKLEPGVKVENTYIEFYNEAKPETGESNKDKKIINDRFKGTLNLLKLDVNKNNVNFKFNNESIVKLDFINLIFESGKLNVSNEIKTPILIDVNNVISTSLAYTKSLGKVSLTPSVELGNKTEFNLNINTKSDVYLINTINAGVFLQTNYKPVEEVELIAKLGASTDYRLKLNLNGNELNHGFTKFEPSLSLTAKFNW